MITITSGMALWKYSYASSARIFCGWYTGIPAATAASFTGELDLTWPRPRGRSGCVTTPSTLNSLCASSSRRLGRANAGVPQKTILSGGTRVLPLAGFFQLANFTLDEVALEHTQVRDEQDAVQVIDLVAESTGEQAFAAAFELGARRVLRADGDVLRTFDVATKPWQRKAAFFFALLAFGVNNFGIGQDHLRLRNFPIGDVDHREPQAHANLRRCEPHAIRGVHGFEHVRDEFLEVLVEFIHTLARSFQHRVAVFHDRMNHLQSVPMLGSQMNVRRYRSLATRYLSLELVQLPLVAIEIAAGFADGIATEFFQECAGQFHRYHRFARNAACRDYTNIRTLVRRLHGFFGLQIRGEQRAAQRRDRFQISAHNHVAAVSNAAFQAAGTIRGTVEALLRGVVDDLVLHFRPVTRGICNTRAEFHCFYGLNRHHGAGDARIEFFIPLRVTAQARRDSARYHFKNAADGISGAQNVIHFSDHTRFAGRIHAAQRRFQIFAHAGDFFPGGGPLQARVADGDGVAEHFRREFAQQ